MKKLMLIFVIVLFVVSCDGNTYRIVNSVVPDDVKEEICDHLPPGICKHKLPDDLKTDTTVVDTTG